MKFLKPLLVSAVFVATSSMAIAAVDTTTININVTEAPSLLLSGTVVTDGTDKDFTVAAIQAATSQTVLLGTLGSDSNISGNCNMSFASTNGFSLVDPLSSVVLAGYSLKYGSEAPIAVDTTYSQTCQFTAAALNMIVGTLPTTIAAGTYSDVVTVTVATP